MAVKSFNEGSAVTVTARFRNDGSSVVPLTVRYRVDNRTSRQTVLDWTEASPASTVTITVPATLNVLANQRNKSERFAVTFEANHGTATAFTNAKQYDVQNLNGIE